jgi:hypothetical protein
MKKTIFANRFGLVALMSLSLFASTAFAGNGTSQVVVTNTAANPVPVAVQKAELYQVTQQVSCTNNDHAEFAFSVPSGKTLLIHNFNVFGGSYNATDTFGVDMNSDNFTSFLGFSMQPVGGYFSWNSTWATNQQIQMSATQTVGGRIGRTSNNYAPACEFYVTISGELF